MTTQKKDDRPHRVPVSLPELRRLLNRLVWLIQHLPDHVWHWSLWRRRKQFLAKRAHFKSRGLVLDDYLRL